MEWVKALLHCPHWWGRGGQSTLIAAQGRSVLTLRWSVDLYRIASKTETATSCHERFNGLSRAWATTTTTHSKLLLHFLSITISHLMTIGLIIIIISVIRDLKWMPRKKAGIWG